jgi:hypothetical protein
MSNRTGQRVKEHGHAKLSAAEHHTMAVEGGFDPVMVETLRILDKEVFKLHGNEDTVETAKLLLNEIGESLTGAKPTLRLHQFRQRAIRKAVATLLYAINERNEKFFGDMAKMFGRKNDKPAKLSSADPLREVLSEIRFYQECSAGGEPLMAPMTLNEYQEAVKGMTGILFEITAIRKAVKDVGAHRRKGKRVPKTSKP